jgi:hypothetical protein
MTLTETLRLETRYLDYDDLRAVQYCEKRWQEEGRPTERWRIINFLEKMLRELKEHFGAYPKVLLLRKKELQRRTFTIPQPGEETVTDGCCCSGGWLSDGRPCSCPKGEPNRERLRRWGMQL